jgi:hypothetical protein
MRSACRVKVLAAVLMISAVAVPARAAPTLVSFPPSTNGEALESWLRANTSLEPQDIIAIGGGRVVGLRSREAEPGAPGVVKLTVRTEIIDQASAEQEKALSESNVLEIDCAARRAKLTQALQYTERNLIGTMRVREPWKDWIVANPGTTLDRMVGAACEKDLHAVPAPERKAAARPEGGHADGGHAEGARLDLPAAPATPLVFGPPSLDSLRGRSASPTVRAPAAAPRDEPRPGLKATRAAPAAAAKSAAVPIVHGHAGVGSWVQIGAWTERGQADAALGRAKADRPQLLGGRPTSVETTVVGGRTYYRGLVGGFSGQEDARRLCGQLKAAGGSCLVRLR